MHSHLSTDNPFRESEDRLHFAKALDRLKTAQNKNHATFTDFMNPQRSVVFLQQFTKKGVAARAYGGHEDAERMMLGFAPPYPQSAPRDRHRSDLYYDDIAEEFENNGIENKTCGEAESPPEALLPNSSFPITPLAITYNERFSRKLTHRDFLGAVLGLGLDWGKIGDIRIGESGAVMYVAQEVAGYITENLLEVGRTSVTATTHIELPGIEPTGTQKRITAASLRLDAVISVAFHLSRGKASTLIEAEKVFVNWAIAKKTMQLSEGDIVTIRGTGRLRIDAISGPTKKDRVALMVTLY